MLASFMPDPLHAALVHMPVAFAVLAPVAAAGALLLVSRGADVPRSWGMVVVLLASLRQTRYRDSPLRRQRRIPARHSSVAPSMAYHTSRPRTSAALAWDWATP